MFKSYYLQSGKEFSTYIFYKISFAENNNLKHCCFNQYQWHKSEDIDFIFYLLCDHG